MEYCRKIQPVRSRSLPRHLKLVGTEGNGRSKMPQSQFVMNSARLKRGLKTVFLMNEGSSIDDAGHMIFSVYVDLRSAANRTPITTLVKACEKRFAIDSCKRIRISKPSRFREYGENLIRDLGEGYSKNTTYVEERVDDPEDLAKAKLLDKERNRASELIGSRATFNTEKVTSWERSYQSLTFGKNCWIFCASIQPTTTEETERWWKTMPGEYDHTTRIHRRREFARALSSMVAEQLGAQGKETEMKHTFDGKLSLRTLHKTQMLIHGPVIYVDDPYATISNAPEGWNFLAISSFIKHVRFRDQREYRFVVLAEEEPSREFQELIVSHAMLGAMERRKGESARLSFPSIVWEKKSSDMATKVAGPVHELVAQESEHESIPHLSKLATKLPRLPVSRRDSVSIAPSRYETTDLPEDYEEMTTTYAATKALRRLARGPFDRQGVEAASSAWHIEPCIRHLCAVFDDPIRNVRMTQDNFVVITLNFPLESKSEGKISVGPLGTGNYHIKRSRESTFSVDEEAWSLGISMEDALKEAGLPVRQKRTAG